jgi:hypothetical protein
MPENLSHYLLAAGCLAARVRQHGRARLLRVLLGLWAAGLVAVTAFPTSSPGTEVTTGAVVHRYGAALAVAVPPIVGLLVARSRRLWMASLVTATAAVLYGVAHPPAMLSGAEVLPLAGLAERILLVLVLLVVALTSSELRES